MLMIGRAWLSDNCEKRARGAIAPPMRLATPALRIPRCSLTTSTGPTRRPVPGNVENTDAVPSSTEKFDNLSAVRRREYTSRKLVVRGRTLYLVGRYAVRRRAAALACRNKPRNWKKLARTIRTKPNRRVASSMLN